MKKILFTSTFVFLLCFMMINTIMAQSPELIKYQAVLRDASGNVVANTAKTVVVDILQGSSSGTSVYQETHSVTTTAQGVINLNIGGGTPVSGTFSTIDWSSYTYWAKLMVDATEITNGQLLSVPYALSLKGITRNPVNGNIGIGTTNPGFKLEVVGGVIHADNNGGVCVRLGDDANLNDINVNNTLGVYGVQDNTQGHIKLGSNGPTVSGKSGYLGLGVTSPASLLDIYGTGSRENITLKSNAADFGPELRLISTAASGHHWRLVSGASASNSFGAGSFEIWDQTAGASRFGIASDGKVGIGTITPGYLLDVNGTGMFRGNLSINTGSNDAILKLGPSQKAAIGYAQNWVQNNLYINGWDEWDGTYVNGNEFYLDCRAWIYNQNDLVFKGYGANADYWMENYDDGGAEDFRVSEGSSIRAYLQNGSNGWKTPSDRRLKDNITTLNVLDKIDGIRGCSYLIKDSGMPQIGVIAQEMQAAFPIAVSGNESEGMLGVDYNAVASIALQGVKELKEKVDQLEKENAALKAQVGEYSTLKAEIETLKNLIGGEKLGSR